LKKKGKKEGDEQRRKRDGRGRGMFLLHDIDESSLGEGEIYRQRRWEEELGGSGGEKLHS